MKHLVALLLAVLMVLGMVACGEKEEVSAQTEAEITEETVAEDTEETEAADETEETGETEDTEDIGEVAQQEEIDYKDLLLSEEWKWVEGNMTHYFNGNGNGHYESGGYKFELEWELDGAQVSILYPSFSENAGVFEFVLEDDIWSLRNGDMLHVRASDYTAACELYAPEIEVEYFEECKTLPTPDSCAFAGANGKNTSSSNGKTTQILYRYTIAGEEILQNYIAFLEEAGFTTEDLSEGEQKTINILENGYIVAVIYAIGDEMNVSIIPQDQREMTASAAEPIALGDVIVTPDYTFTLETVELTYELLPKNTGGWYTSYPADPDHVYLHVGGTLENTSKRTIRIDELFVAKADYDNGYVYSGFAVVDEADGTGFDYAGSYAAAEPLETCGYHCLISCPELVDESDAPLFVLFTLADGVTYRYDIR